MSVSKHIPIGRVRKLHGVKGLINIELVHEIRDSFPPYLLIGRGKPLPYFVSSVSAQGNSTFLVALEDIQNRSEAEKLKACEVYIKEADFESYFQEPESSLPDIEGYTLFDSQGRLIGTMVGYQELPQQILIAAENEGREVLIPLLENTIENLEPETKTARLNLPDGLLDLYL